MCKRLFWFFLLSLMTLNQSIAQGTMPTAEDDSFNSCLGAPNELDVLSNDSYASDLPLSMTLSVVSGPSNGTATPNDNGTPNNPNDDFIDYQSNAGFFGAPDSFVYQITDSDGDSVTATASIAFTIDSDNDGISDNCDTDDDNDGILDVNDGLSTVASCTTVNTPVTGVTDSNLQSSSANLINNGVVVADQGMAMNNSAHYAVIDLGEVLEAMTTVRFDWWINSANGARQQTITQVASVTGSTTGTNPLVIDYPLNSTESNFFTYTLDAPTRYLLVDMTLRVGGRVELTEATIQQSCTLSIDSDADGIPDHLDTDSDNDGCPDALEGNGVITLSQLTDLTDGSNGGSIQNLGNASDTNGSPIVSGSSFIQNTTPSVLNVALTSDQCDDDNDGVINLNDLCNGFDDTIDTDKDSVPDACDEDDDNDGILDVNEGLSTVASCTTVNTPVTGVTDSNLQSSSANLINNGAVVANQGMDMNRISHYAVIDLGEVLEAMTTVRFDWWINSANGARQQTITQVASATGSTTGTNPLVIDYPLNSTESNFFIYTLDAPTRYLLVDMTLRVSGRVELTEATIQQSCPVFIDTDADRIPDHLDTDSDNDGCPDAIEAIGNIDISQLTTLIGGSIGGSSDNLGVDSDAEGNPKLNTTDAIGFVQATTAAVTDTTDSSACVADLSLTKTVNKAIIKIGENIVYTLSVTNNGPLSATGVQVTNVLPTGLIYVSDDSITTSTTYISNLWDIGDIAFNQTVNLKITAKVSQSGILVNTSEVTQSNQTDSDSLPNNSN